MIFKVTDIINIHIVAITAYWTALKDGLELLHSDNRSRPVTGKNRKSP